MTNQPSMPSTFATQTYAEVPAQYLDLPATVVAGGVGLGLALPICAVIGVIVARLIR
jgi:hypothetical protein